MAGLLRGMSQTCPPSSSGWSDQGGRAMCQMFRLRMLARSIGKRSNILWNQLAHAWNKPFDMWIVETKHEMQVPHYQKQVVQKHVPKWCCHVLRLPEGFQRTICHFWFSFSHPPLVFLSLAGLWKPKLWRRCSSEIFGQCEYVWI